MPLLSYYQPVEEHVLVHFTEREANIISAACAYWRGWRSQLTQNALDPWDRDCDENQKLATTMSQRINSYRWRILLVMLDQIPNELAPEVVKLHAELTEQTIAARRT